MFAALRFNPDGTLDTDLGTGGLASIPFSPRRDFGVARAVQDDNNIVLAGLMHNQTSSGGWFFGGDFDPDFALARLLGGQLPAPMIKKVSLTSDRKGLVIQLNDSDLVPALATNPTNFRLIAAQGDPNRDGDHFGDADD